jgi:AcrR family transcriptional regulator
MERKSTLKSRGAYHHGDLRNALVEHALAALRAVGPESLSVRALAEQIGVSPSAAYRHFADREGLLAQLARIGFERLRESMAGAAAAAARRQPKTGVRAIGSAYVRFAVAEPELYRLMFGAQRVDKSKYPELGAAAAQAYDTLRTAVMRMAPHAPAGSQELERLTLRCWAMVHGLASLRIDRLIESGSDGEFVELADDLLDRVTQDYPTAVPATAVRRARKPSSI